VFIIYIQLKFLNIKEKKIYKIINKVKSSTSFCFLLNINSKNLRIEGVVGVCSITLDDTNKQLLNVTNYGYHLLGISIPCIIIFIISIVILYRTCQNKNRKNSFQYIAAIIGIIHSLFNLPARLSDILVMLLSPYSPFFSYLIHFNHEAQSFISLSYAYKCFICIIISRRFRFYAKNILCFLIENKYGDRYKNRTRQYITNHQLSRAAVC